MKRGRTQAIRFRELHQRVVPVSGDYVTGGLSRRDPNRVDIDLRYDSVDPVAVSAVQRRALTGGGAGPKLDENAVWQVFPPVRRRYLSITGLDRQRRAYDERGSSPQDDV